MKQWLSINKNCCRLLHQPWMSLQERTGIGIHQCADTGPHLNSTTGGNTHNAPFDAFVLNWCRIGALTYFFSMQAGYFKISLMREPRANERWRGSDAHSDPLSLIFWENSESVRAPVLPVCNKNCHLITTDVEGCASKCGDNWFDNWRDHH